MFRQFQRSTLVTPNREVFRLTAAATQVERDARTTAVKVYFCPSRPAGPQVVNATAEDRASPDVPTLLATNGTAADYAVCVNNTYATPSGGADGPAATGMFRRNDPPFSSSLTLVGVTDGLSNTVMAGEKHVRQGFFTRERSTTPRTADGAIYSPDGIRTYARALGSTHPIVRVVTEGASGNSNERFGSYHTGLCQFVFGDGSVRGLRNETPNLTLDAVATRAGGEVFTLD